MTRLYFNFLASAALESADPHDANRERRFSSSNDENNSLNGNGPSTTVSAMNLSLKPNNNCDNDYNISSKTILKPCLYPKAHLLNIPNPNRDELTLRFETKCFFLIYFH